MLVIGSQLINYPIMGIQTGGRLGLTGSPLINPSNLKIVAYEVNGPNIKSLLYLRTIDIREFSKIGMIVDSSDEFIKPDDVIAIKKIIDLHFNLVGLKVLDDHKNHLGKIKDFTVDANSFVIQQLIVQRTLVKRFNEPEIRVHRSQIIEVSDDYIVIKSGAVKQKAVTPQTAPNLDFINPFRQKSPQVETQKTN